MNDEKKKEEEKKTHNEVLSSINVRSVVRR